MSDIPAKKTIKTAEVGDWLLITCRESSRRTVTKGDTVTAVWSK